MSARAKNTGSFSPKRSSYHSFTTQQFTQGSIQTLTGILRSLVYLDNDTYWRAVTVQILDHGINGIFFMYLLVSSPVQLVVEVMIPGCHQRLEIFTPHDLRKEALDQRIWYPEQTGDFLSMSAHVGPCRVVSKKHPILGNDGINSGLGIKVHLSRIRQANLEDFM